MLIGITTLAYMLYDSITLMHSANAVNSTVIVMAPEPMLHTCLLYTSDAADE